jgi:hypothetical protein
MRRLTQAESARLAAVAERTRRNVDETAGLLLLAAAQGDGSALLALADRLEEIGRPAQAAQIRAAAADLECDAAWVASANSLVDSWQLQYRDACRHMANVAYCRAGAGGEERAALAVAAALKEEFVEYLWVHAIEFEGERGPALERIDWLARARRLIAEAGAEALEALAPEDKGAMRMADWWVDQHMHACMNTARNVYNWAGPSGLEPPEDVTDLELARNAYEFSLVNGEERAALALAPLLKEAFETGWDWCNGTMEFDLTAMTATPAALARLDWLPQARRLISVVSAQPLLPLWVRAAFRCWQHSPGCLELPIWLTRFTEETAAETNRRG